MQTICGMVVGDGPVEPGTWWDVTMDIDADECGEEPVFSVVSMLGEVFRRKFVGIAFILVMRNIITLVVQVDVLKGRVYASFSLCKVA